MLSKLKCFQKQFWELNLWSTSIYKQLKSSGHPSLKMCAAMEGRPYCTICNCDLQKHMHIRVEYVKVKRSIIDSNKQIEINSAEKRWRCARSDNTCFGSLRYRGLESPGFLESWCIYGSEKSNCPALSGTLYEKYKNVYYSQFSL